MVFLNFALPGTLARLSKLLAFGGNDDWEERYPVPLVARYIQEAISFFRAQGPMPLQHHRSKPMDLFTDATTTQAGVTHPDLRRHYLCRIPQKPIYRAEATAVDIGLSLPLPREVRLRIDNRALVYAIKKGRSNCREANRVCDKIRRLRLRGHIISAKWIPSASNPADIPSRTLITTGPGVLLSAPF